MLSLGLNKGTSGLTGTSDPGLNRQHYYIGNYRKELWDLCHGLPWPSLDNLDLSPKHGDLVDNRKFDILHDQISCRSVG